MNYLKLLICLALGANIVSSCQKEIEAIPLEVSKKHHSTEHTVGVPNSEQEALDLIALGISTAGQKDEMFASKLSQLSSEKFDGDFDYLAIKLYDGSGLRTMEQSVSDTMMESFKDLLGKDAVNIINEIALKYPLINIYTPFSKEDFISSKDYLIVVDKITGKDGKDYPMLAFNKKGEPVQLSSSEEPKIPYIVIGKNERVLVTSNDELRSNNSHTYHKNKNHSFSLKKGILNIEQNRDLRLLSLDDTPYFDDSDPFDKFRKYRTIGDKDTYDYISQASFMSKSALQRVEGWSRGQPEIFLTIFFDSILDKGSDTQIYNDKYKLKFDLGEEGWYRGSRSWLKPGRFEVRTNTKGWQTVRWSVIAKPTQMRYYFVEEDGSFDVSVEYKGVKAVFNLSGSADFIGETVVDFYDSLPREYPMGGSFKFTLDLR